MSKKPRRKFDLERFRASAERRAEEAKKLWASLYSEPICIDEDSLKSAAQVKLPDDLRDNLNRAADLLRDEVRRQGGVPPG